MKRYSLNLAPGVAVEIDHPGRFFSLLGAALPVDVSLQSAGLVSETLESITAGVWCDFGERTFSRVRIVSDVAQTVSFVVSMIRIGWELPPPSCITVSMALAGQAASSVASTSVIDLGDDWASCVLGAQADLLVAGAGGSMSITCDDSPSMSLQRLACGIGYSNVAYVLVSGTNHHISSIRPTGRYVRGNFTNGANDQAGPARFMLHIMRNVTA